MHHPPESVGIGRRSTSYVREESRRLSVGVPGLPGQGRPHRLVESKRFRRVFGGDYESTDPVWEYHPDLHLTQYAATMPCEDFAETFHYYLRHKGCLPRRLAGKPEIIRKWEFIQRLASR